MDDDNKTFGFVNPARHGTLEFSSSSRSQLWELGTRTCHHFFPQYSQLCLDLRLEILRLVVKDTETFLNDWHTNRSIAVVVQSRRGILQRKQPPGLARLACVSKEWQEHIERYLFSVLLIRDLPENSCSLESDLDVFATIVTGPRRRYLSILQIELTFNLKRSKPVDTSTIQRSMRAYRTGRFSTCVTRLFQILSSWVCQEVADDLLTVVLDVHLPEYFFFDLRGNLEDLPMVSVIGELLINTKPYHFRVLPRTLLNLLRKLPQLRSVALGISPWCCSGDQDYSSQIKVLTKGISSATPHVTHLLLTIPFFFRCSWHGLSTTSISITGRSVSSIREMSYRLKTLIVDSSIDLSLFFEKFHRDTENQDIEVRPLWPALQILELQGPLFKGDSSEKEHYNDHDLKIIGRSTKFMPELKRLSIHIDSSPWDELRSRQMNFLFWNGSYLTKTEDSEQLHLSIQHHIPSSSAIGVWREALLYTKCAPLAVEFNLAPKYDEDGEPRYENWHAWESWQTNSETCAFQGSEWVGSCDE